MVSVQEAFTDAWRSHRIRQGDDPSTLPDPLGGSRHAERQKERARKRRRGEEEDKGDSGGGFIVDEQAGTSEGDDEEQGRQGQPSTPEHIPLSSIPDALASLGLPTSDDFVLDLFAQTATHVNTDPRRRRKTGGEGSEKVVSLHDFTRVAEVLLDDGGEKGREEKGQDDDGEEAPSKRTLRPVRAAASKANRRRQKYEREEALEASEDGDADSDDFETGAGEEEEEEAERAAAKPKRTMRVRAKGKEEASTSRGARGKKSASGGLRRGRNRDRSSGEDEDEEDDNGSDEEGHLTTHQRRQVHAAFRLFTNKLSELRGADLDDAPRLSKEDVKLLVTSVGEKIPEKEVDEMIEEGVRFFAKGSSKDVTRQTSRLRREAAAGRATARGQVNRSQTIGIDEFAGILLKGRLI